MGRFDKKVSKAEPEAPTSQKILKKKSNAQLAKLERDPKSEKERNMKILNWMQKADEVKNPRASKADAHLNTDKMVSKQLRKEQKNRKRVKDEWIQL